MQDNAHLHGQELAQVTRKAGLAVLTVALLPAVIIALLLHSGVNQPAPLYSGLGASLLGAGLGIGILLGKWQAVYATMALVIVSGCGIVYAAMQAGELRGGLIGAVLLTTTTPWLFRLGGSMRRVAAAAQCHQ